MKATDHELQKYDNFTRYGQVAAKRRSTPCCAGPSFSKLFCFHPII
jgi:hypothetical protein